jgi:hypothetical protein
MPFSPPRKNRSVNSRGRIRPDPCKYRQDRRLTSRLRPLIISELLLENHKFGEGGLIMNRCSICMVILIGTATAAPAEEKPTPPMKGSPRPVAVLAQANEKDGKVVVRFSLPVEVPDGADLVGGPDRAPIIGARSKMGWFDVDLVVDDKTVRALTTDGKAIDPKTLPKRLAKASRVVLFQGKANPDPFYLGLFREDAVLFVAPADKFQIP